MKVLAKGQTKNTNLFRRTNNKNGKNSSHKEVTLSNFNCPLEAKGGGFNAKSLDLT